jgi:hypothetical protein
MSDRSFTENRVLRLEDITRGLMRDLADARDKLARLQQALALIRQATSGGGGGGGGVQSAVALAPIPPVVGNVATPGFVVLRTLSNSGNITSVNTVVAFNTFTTTIFSANRAAIVGQDPNGIWLGLVEDCA